MKGAATLPYGQAELSGFHGASIPAVGLRPTPWDAVYTLAGFPSSLGSWLEPVLSRGPQVGGNPVIQQVLFLPPPQPKQGFHAIVRAFVFPSPGDQVLRWSWPDLSRMILRVYLPGLML